MTQPSEAPKTIALWCNSSTALSKSVGLGANPSGAAIYVDNETGREVTEDWWPGDAHP